MSHPAAPTTGPDAPQFIEPKDIPAQMNPSPANMPGAQRDPIPPATQTTPPADVVTPTDTGAIDESADSVPMARFKEYQKINRKLENEAKANRTAAEANRADAEAYRKLQQLVSPGEAEAAAADPMQAIADLRTELTGERTERLRERIAHDAGVPISQVVGADEETMKATAEAANSWAQEKVNALLKQAGVPLAAPAANVTSADNPSVKDTQLIQSRDELKNMTSQQITDAYKSGRMDKLLGKTS
jgi:hypothetical protein